MKKTKFKDLSKPLKWAVVFAYIGGIYVCLVFSIGFIYGVFGL